MNKQKPFFLLTALAGAFAWYLFSFIQTDNPLLQVIGASAGALFTVAFLGILYVKCDGAKKKQGLKILDWVFIGTTLSLMGCFQLLGVPPYYWTLLVVFPLYGVRVVIHYILYNMPKNVQILKPKFALKKNKTKQERN